MIERGEQPCFGVRGLVRALPPGDLSPGQRAFSARLSSRIALSAFDGDKSPDESSDKSPHSKEASTLLATRSSLPVDAP